jgi:mannose-1-phosphate guanylyltransferase
MQMNSYAIIMAGGVGTRFWPHGSAKLPKQFLPIADSALTMLQMTAKRSRRIAPPERTLVITNRQYVDEVKNQLPDVPERNIIGEPVGKNTAPCIGLAAFILKQFDEHSGMVVIPADHLIEDEVKFENVIKAGLSFVERNDAIVTLGITPTHPETGYGYIQFIDEPTPTAAGADSPTVYKVKTFAEKPTLETAKSFLESGDFLWNSGMFIFRTEVILQEMKKLLPNTFKSLAGLEQYMGAPQFHDLLEKAYDEIKSISIDYGVMEKTKHAYVIKTDFSWSDVGSWDEVYRIKTRDKNGNVIVGKSYVKDSTGNLVVSTDAFVGLIGVKDLIVVNTRDGLLICKRGRSQEVKEVVDYLKRKGMMENL